MAFRKFLTFQKKNKYNAKPKIVDGIKFHSTSEANRYIELQIAVRAGAIQNLRRQVPYKMVINGVKICTYYADFVYLEDGKEVVEDTKGYHTDIYKLKKKLMLAINNIEILET